MRPRYYYTPPKKKQSLQSSRSCCKNKERRHFVGAGLDRSSLACEWVQLTPCCTFSFVLKVRKSKIEIIVVKGNLRKKTQLICGNTIIQTSIAFHRPAVLSYSSVI